MLHKLSILASKKPRESLFIALLFAFTLFALPASAFGAPSVTTANIHLMDIAIIESGTAGTCSYELDETGLLSIQPGNFDPTQLIISDENKDKVEKVVFKADGDNKVIVSSYDGVQSKDGTIGRGCSLHLYQFAHMNTCDVAGLDTSQVDNMNYMFAGCEAMNSLRNIKFDTSKATSMSHMFQDCGKIASLDLLIFDTSKVTDMSFMFSGCRSLSSLDISSFNTARVTDMNNMFSSCLHLAAPNLTSFKTSKVTNMSEMFKSCRAFTSLDISSFDTSNVTDMHGMFSGCQYLSSLDLVKLNTSKVTDMNRMFADCKKMTYLNLESFNTSRVTNMKEMFFSCSSLKTIYIDTGWSTFLVIDSEGMFDFCDSLVGGKGTTFNPSITDKSYARNDGDYLHGYLTRIKTIPVPKAHRWIEFNGKDQKGVPEGEGYDISGNVATNPGFYTATVTAKLGYQFTDGVKTATVQWSISPKVNVVPKATKGLVYNGKKQKGVPDGKTYSIKGNAAKNAGSYKATLVAHNGYVFKGGKKTVTVKWSIAKAKQSIKAKSVGKALPVYTKKNKLAQSYMLNLASLSGAKAKTEVIFEKANKSGGKYIVVERKGKVVFKKGLPKKTYTIKVKLSAAGNSNISAAPAKVITFKVKLK